MTAVIQLIMTLGAAIATAMAATAVIVTIVVRPAVIQGNKNHQPLLVVN
jgi:hypothetical protein